MLQPVITVHGIWTEGSWQEEIAPVLYPHFEPASVKYRSYRHLGPLDLVVEPWLFFGGLLLWGAGLLVILWYKFLNVWTVTGLIVVFAVVPILAHLLVHIRLRNTVQKFLDDSAPAVLKGHAHVIGHSLGSYIVCIALRDDPATFAQRILLAGCVVDPKFAWHNLLQGKKPKCEAVRNEVAGRDWVASAARLLRWRHRDFGSAGRHGFEEKSGLVHTVQSPNEPCSQCQPQPDTAAVHNFVSAKKGHSGVLKSTYAKYYWLPFFWSMDAFELREFLDSCFDMMKALVEAGSPDAPPPTGEFDNRATNFLKREWNWARGRTVAKYVADELNHVLSPGDQKIIAFNICHAVAEAETSLGAKVEKWRTDPVARKTYASAEYDEVIKALNPKTALVRAFLVFMNKPKEQ